jgi:hypothetical protein
MLKIQNMLPYQYLVFQTAACGQLVCSDNCLQMHNSLGLLEGLSCMHSLAIINKFLKFLYLHTHLKSTPNEKTSLEKD